MCVHACMCVCMCACVVCVSVVCGIPGSQYPVHAALNQYIYVWEDVIVYPIKLRDNTYITSGSMNYIIDFRSWVTGLSHSAVIKN